MVRVLYYKNVTTKVNCRSILTITVFLLILSVRIILELRSIHMHSGMPVFVLPLMLTCCFLSDWPVLLIQVRKNHDCFENVR